VAGKIIVFLKLLAFVLCFALGTAIASAEDITVTGADGTAAMPAGQDATANAGPGSGPDPTNTATATGGTGFGSGGGGKRQRWYIFVLLDHYEQAVAAVNHKFNRSWNWPLKACLALEGAFVGSRDVKSKASLSRECDYSGNRDLMARSRSIHSGALPTRFHQNAQWA